MENVYLYYIQWVIGVVPISQLLQGARGCWRPIPPWAPTGVLYTDWPFLHIEIDVFKMCLMIEAGTITLLNALTKG